MFQLIVMNPKTALSVGVMPYCLPQGQAGRQVCAAVHGVLHLRRNLCKYKNQIFSCPLDEWKTCNPAESRKNVKQEEA